MARSRKKRDPELSRTALKALVARTNARHRRQEAQARAQVRKFRPRKSERGKIVLVGHGGKRLGGFGERQSRKRGYAVYVTRTGKKWLPHPKVIPDPFKARRRAEIELPATGNLRKAAAAFQLARKRKRSGVAGAPPQDLRRAEREIRKERLTGAQAQTLRGFITQGRGLNRTHIDTRNTGGLNEQAIDKLTRQLKRVFEGQASRRNFNIEVLALVQLPDRSKQVIQFELSIGRMDADEVQIGGLRNFISQKFYAFFAREMAYHGYVTAGSRNHIRHLRGNRNLPESQWTDRQGRPWGGRNKETVKLLTIEWRVSQK